MNAQKVTSENKEKIEHAKNKPLSLVETIAYAKAIVVLYVFLFTFWMVSFFITLNVQAGPIHAASNSAY
jgi:hypothetical protein